LSNIKSENNKLKYIISLLIFEKFIEVTNEDSIFYNPISFNVFKTLFAAFKLKNGPALNLSVICEFGISIVIKILFSFSSSYIQYSLII
jgi:hypothetical protein